jgi:hypothetical protein
MRWFGAVLTLLVLFVPATALAEDFTVTNTGMTSYNVNGAANPALTLQRGKSYTFAVNSPGHPFFIKTAQVTGTGSTWDEGVVNNGATSGTLTFTVPSDAPATLFYQCSIHTVMTAAIAITAPVVPAATPFALALLAIGMAAGGWLVFRRVRLRAVSAGA